MIQFEICINRSVLCWTTYNYTFFGWS